MQITYIIQKSRRPSISVSVLSDGRVLVKAPYRTTEQSVQEFLASKKAWITKQIEKQNLQIQKAKELGFLSEDEIKQLKKSSFLCLVAVVSFSFFISNIIEINSKPSSVVSLKI